MARFHGRDWQTKRLLEQCSETSVSFFPRYNFEAISCSCSCESRARLHKRILAWKRTPILKQTQPFRHKQWFGNQTWHVLRIRSARRNQIRNGKKRRDSRGLRESVPSHGNKGTDEKLYSIDPPSFFSSDSSVLYSCCAVAVRFSRDETESVCVDAPDRNRPDSSRRRRSA